MIIVALINLLEPLCGDVVLFEICTSPTESCAAWKKISQILRLHGWWQVFILRAQSHFTSYVTAVLLTL
jgi:hypothetical protein